MDAIRERSILVWLSALLETLGEERGDGQSSVVSFSLAIFPTPPPILSLSDYSSGLTLICSPTPQPSTSRFSTSYTAREPRLGTDQLAPNSLQIWRRLSSRRTSCSFQTRKLQTAAITHCRIRPRPNVEARPLQAPPPNARILRFKLNCLSGSHTVYPDTAHHLYRCFGVAFGGSSRGGLGFYRTWGIFPPPLPLGSHPHSGGRRLPTYPPPGPFCLLRKLRNRFVVSHWGKRLLSLARDCKPKWDEFFAG